MALGDIGKGSAYCEALLVSRQLALTVDDNV